MFAHENMKNLTSKVGYFRKIKEKFITALAAQKAEKATKIWKNHALCFDAQKTEWCFFSNFLVFVQYLNFTTKSLLLCRTGYLDWDGECIFAHGANGPDRPSMNLIDITIMPAFVAKDFRPKTRQVRYVAQLDEIFYVGVF